MAVIYALECSVNGFAYVGVTKAKLSKRFREHRCLCNNDKHHAVKLTEDWKRYGEASFSMKVLEEAEYSHRGSHCAAEQKWIEHYASLGKLYNANERSSGLGAEITRKGIEASRTVAGNRWTPEANEKRRLAQLGKPKGHGAKISATKQAKKLLIRDDIV
jgi:group I intron endonuclease